MNNSKTGWIHPDAQLSPDAGICYGVRYIGCIEVKESMKALDFETRTTIARESINRVAEAAGLKTSSGRKKIDHHLEKKIGDAPQMQYSGSNVNLTITTESISLMIMESGEVIASHPLHVVSFASGGDMDTLDFVSYVAKDSDSSRACYVLECGGGLAEDVVTTIGQAFELRFKQHMKKHPAEFELHDRQEKPRFENEHLGDREDYYNDNPKAVPPESDLASAEALPEVFPPPLPEHNHPSKKESYGQDRNKSACGGHAHDSRDEESKIADLVNGVELDGRFNHSSNKDTNVQAGVALDVAATPFIPELLTVDLPPAPEPPSTSPSKISQKSEADPQGNKSAPSSNSLEPVFENWYHGDLSRKQAEALLEFDGDFLVRKSANSPGQYVLSGKQTGAPRHLLLVDPEGNVRTRDFIFDSVSHLINYHRQKGLPIITQGSELQLVRPVKPCPTK